MKNSPSRYGRALPAALASMCLAYWGACAWLDRLPSFSRGKPTIISLHSGHAPIASATLPARERSAVASDPAGSLLAGVGYALRYASGQYPDFIFAGDDRLPRRLYLRAEAYFQFPEAREEIRKQLPDALLAYAKALRSRGVHFVVLPVPTKVAIERDRIAGTLPADRLWSRPRRSLRQVEAADWVYSVFSERLPGFVVDLQSTYRRYSKDHPGADLFVPTDTHWSSLGIALAAKAVAEHLQARKIPDARSPGEVVLARIEPPSPGHDLLKALQLPSWLFAVDPSVRWREPIYGFSDAMPRRAVSSERRVLIAGSCYSRRFREEPHGLGNLLARILRRSYVDFSFRNSIATGPLAELARNQIALYPGDVLIWEFPVRTPPSQNEIPSLPPIDG